MTSHGNNLSDRPIVSRKEFVERMVAAFGKPERVNSRNLIWHPEIRFVKQGKW